LVYPVIDGILRLMIEAFIDFEEFFSENLTDYQIRRKQLEEKYSDLIHYTIKKMLTLKKVFHRNGMFSIRKKIAPGT